MAKNLFTPLSGERVLVTAKVGKRIVGIFALLQAICFVIGSGLLTGGIMAWLKHVDKAFIAVIAAGVVYAAIFILLGMYISAKNRLYVLTDRRIVIVRGGKMKLSNRSLSLKSVQGVQKDNNFLYNAFGLATIDFYALAVASNTTKIKIFSFSSTSFKFQWVDVSDADLVYRLMQQYLADGDFAKVSPTPTAPNEATL